MNRGGGRGRGGVHGAWARGVPGRGGTQATGGPPGFDQELDADFPPMPLGLNGDSQGASRGGSRGGSAPQRVWGARGGGAPRVSEERSVEPEKTPLPPSLPVEPVVEVSHACEALQLGDGNQIRPRECEREVRRGRGVAEGRRGAKRTVRTEQHDVVASKSIECRKQGSKGVNLDLVTNFFELEKKTNWCLYHYRVDFNPEVEKTVEKKKLLHPHAASLGAHIFDGASLYSSSRLSPDPLELFSLRENSRDKIRIIARLVGQMDPTDSMYIQFYNIVIRKIMSEMNLEEVGRNYYNPHAPIRLENERLILWPGYKTSMRHHEEKTLLCVEMTHKVIRQDSCLQIIKEARGDRAKIAEELLGAVVITRYNSKNYRIDDIDWNSKPTTCFEQGNTKVSFVEYYVQKYGNKFKVTDVDQPLLVSRPKKKDYHRGITGPILLIPEFCQMTGLSDSMRANHNLTRALAGHLSVPPEKRIKIAEEFIMKTQTITKIKEELNRWDLKLKLKPVTVKGRELESQEIMFGNNKKDKVGRDGDFTMLCKKYSMYEPKSLQAWVVIVPQRLEGAANKLITTMKDLHGLGMLVAQPQMIRLTNDRTQGYHDGIENAVKCLREKTQLIVAILPNNRQDTYAVVKKRCCVEYGIPSQCLLSKNTDNPAKFRSICTKLMIQMNSKLGGQAWALNFPLTDLMVLGFDVYHCGKNRGQSVGALVASTNKQVSKFFSTYCYHSSREELASNLCGDLTKCLHAYYTLNNVLPSRIIMYRDGVGDGQLTFVYNTELTQIRTAINNVYTSHSQLLPKFSFIVVTKRINARIFQRTVRPNGSQGPPVNPPAGTIVDDVITLPERFDFYMVPQSVRVGSVSPTSFNVLVDEQGLPTDVIHLLTYRLCHMYYNWSGTVAVPAPCQYAHKLAYLAGIALGRSFTNRLSNTLYFL